MVLATHARRWRYKYRLGGSPGCRCTPSWFAGSSGRLRPKKQESNYSKHVLFGHRLPVHSPGLWNLEQLVPSTPCQKIVIPQKKLMVRRCQAKTNEAGMFILIYVFPFSIYLYINSKHVAIYTLKLDVFEERER